MFPHKKITQKFTQTAVHYLPVHTRFLLGTLPGKLVQSSLEFWLDRIFKPTLCKGELSFLQHRTVCIDITDIALRFTVTLQKNRLCAVVNPLHGDVTFKAASGDLLLLITGKRDPDTLFFRRRLMITGDTELGLALKNFLDTLDAASLIPMQLYPFLDHLAQGFAAHHDQKKPSRQGHANAAAT